MQLRLELEFEHIDEEKNEVLDVEELRKKENKMLANFFI